MCPTSAGFSDLSFFFIFAGIFVFVCLIYFLNNIKGQRALETLNVLFQGASWKWSIFVPEFRGQFQGLDLRIRLIPASRNSPSCLEVVLFRKSYLRFSVYREGFLSNFGKSLGLVQEVTTSDESLDKEFLIFSNLKEEAGRLFRQQDVQAALRNIFSSGFVSLVFNGKKIIIRKQNFNIYSDVTPEQMKFIVHELFILLKGLPLAP